MPLTNVFRLLGSRNSRNFVSGVTIARSANNYVYRHHVESRVPDGTSRPHDDCVIFDFATHTCVDIHARVRALIIIFMFTYRASNNTE